MPAAGVLLALAMALSPAVAFAATPSPSASPSPAPSPALSPRPSASPTSSPSATASPTPSPKVIVASPTPSPSVTPSPSALRVWPNREAQAQLIADLTSAEAHALMLERSLNQSQVNLIALGQQVFDAERELSRLNSQLNAIVQEQALTTNKLRQDRLALSGIVRRVYKRQNSFFANLVAAGGFGGLLRAIGYGDVLVDKEQALIRSVEADQAALQRAQTRLNRTRADERATLERLSQTRLALSKQIEAERALQTDLQGAIDAALGALDAMETDSPTVASERARLVRLRTDSVVRQIQQAVWAQDTFLRTARLTSVDPELRASGRFLWPIPNATISQPFGPSTYRFEAAYAGYTHFHTGIDLAVPPGTPVFAAADGVVALARPMTDPAGNLVGYGNYVVIVHDPGLKTLYGHLLTILAKEGDLVKRGDLIGLVGSTGNSTGPHTHFEVRVENTPIDPIQMLPPAVPHSGHRPSS